MADGDDMYSALDIAKYIISKCNNAGADNRKQCNRKLYDVGGSMLCDGDRSAAYCCRNCRDYRSDGMQRTV